MKDLRASAAYRRVQRIHYKIANIRKDTIHKMTTTIVKTKPSIIVIEDVLTLKIP